MIKEKISNLELEYTNDTERLKTIKAIKELLSQIDLSTEIIPIDNNEKLTNLLSFIKGEELCKEEILLIKQLVT